MEGCLCRCIVALSQYILLNPGLQTAQTWKAGVKMLSPQKMDSPIATHGNLDGQLFCLHPKLSQQMYIVPPFFERRAQATP